MDVQPTPAGFPHLFTDPGLALKFLIGENATVSLQSDRTGDHYTYKISAPRQRGPLDTRTDIFIRFVKLLVAPDEYQYIGSIRESQFHNNTFRLLSTKASKIDINSKPCRAMNYALTYLTTNMMPPDVKIWHNGRCGRCQRELTTPESVATGFGPECSKILGVTRVETAPNADRTRSRHFNAVRDFYREPGW